MIVGPTASGKSDLAFRLAMETDGEIISVDSRQCYKRIDIGTAKPKPAQLNKIKHYNISILDLDQKDTVVSFLERAGLWRNEIESRNRKVIYAGGSTLHLQGLMQPMDTLPESNPRNIALLKKRADTDGVEKLYRELLNVDPHYAGSMDGLNRQRIIRALDVWMQTGRPFSSFHTRDEPVLPDGFLVYGLHWPRKTLHKRINTRVDRMIRAGLVEETRKILNDGYSPDIQSLQTVGYRDVIHYLEGNLSREQMIADIKTQTRRYAKRQITWFRRWPFIKWLEPGIQTVDHMVCNIQQDLACTTHTGKKS